MSKFTHEQRLKMLFAALDLCPACQEEFNRYARSSGRSTFQQVREVFWKWFGTWDHGNGCPEPAAPVVLPEAPAPEGRSDTVPAETGKSEVN